MGMERTRRYGFETPTYRYAAVERALGAMLGTTDTAIREGQLRGRLKRLLVLGCPRQGLARARGVFIRGRRPASSRLPCCLKTPTSSRLS